MQITIIRTDDSREVREVEFPDVESAKWKDFRDLLNPIFDAQRKGAAFERVRVLKGAGEYTDMFVDEKGAMLGLPVNLEATREYHRNGITYQGAPHENGIIHGGPKIYGVAVLFESARWN